MRARGEEGKKFSSDAARRFFLVLDVEWFRIVSRGYLKIMRGL